MNFKTTEIKKVYRLLLWCVFSVQGLNFKGILNGYHHPFERTNTLTL